MKSHMYKHKYLNGLTKMLWERTIRNARRRQQKRLDRREDTTGEARRKYSVISFGSACMDITLDRPKRACSSQLVEDTEEEVEDMKTGGQAIW